MNTPKQTKNGLIAPNAPMKKSLYGIPASSPYYTTRRQNANNFGNENMENVEEINLNNLVNSVKEHGIGNNGKLPFHPQLNYKPTVPKMKLPAHLQGGKRKTRRGKLSRKAKKTRKH